MLIKSLHKMWKLQGNEENNSVHYSVSVLRDLDSEYADETFIFSVCNRKKEFNSRTHVQLFFEHFMRDSTIQLQDCSLLCVVNME